MPLFGSQRSEPQQSPSDEQLSPWFWQSHVPSDPHVSEPQQSALDWQELPRSWQAHVPSDPQSRAPQQSALDWQPCVWNAQPHVPLTHWSSQQSLGWLQARPSSRQAPASPVVPVPHVNVFWSQRSAPQQSRSVSQRPPVPAQAGAQVPKSQKTEQQSPSVLQSLPSSMHEPPPASLVGVPASLWPASTPTPPPPIVELTHFPAAQSSEQQSEKLTHDWPLALHAEPPASRVTIEASTPPSCGGGGAPHAPLVHLVLQHCEAVEQLAPSAKQADDWQVPETQSWLQQSVAFMQVAPCAPHIGAAHAPPVHEPAQQSVDDMQLPPDAVQLAATHLPLVHVLLQQSLFCAQFWPVVRQSEPEHVPAEHESLQQSVYVSQAAPAARHLPGGTGILPPSPVIIIVIPVSWPELESMPVVLVSIPPPVVSAKLPSRCGTELSARGLLFPPPLPLLPQPAAVRTPTVTVIKAESSKREGFMSHPVRKRWASSSIMRQDHERRQQTRPDDL